MSVRRLAEASVQPASFAFTEANAAWATQTIGKYPEGRQQSAVIPLLMRAQEQDGWVTKAAIEHVAEMLDMPLIRVLEVATFYTQFQLKPVGTRAHVQVCGTTPCMLRGSEALMDVCRSKIHHEQFHTNESGTLSWEEVECQGACVNAPMVMIFKDAYEDLTPDRLAEIIDAFESGAGDTVTPGPQNGRTYSAPITGLTTLKDEAPLLKANRDKADGTSGMPADGASVAPSNAGKPRTDAPETNATLKSPSPVKASAAAEGAASARPPRGNKAAANQAEPAVEASTEQRTPARTRKSSTATYVAPEAAKGRPIGADGKRQEGEKPAPAGKPTPDGRRAGSRKNEAE